MVLLERFEAPTQQVKNTGEQGFWHHPIGVGCTNIVDQFDSPFEGGMSTFRTRR